MSRSKPTLRTLGLSPVMTAAELNAFLLSFSGYVLNLTGVTVNCETTVQFPSTLSVIKGGEFKRAAGLGSNAWMAVVGTADMGADNTRLNTLTAVTVSSAVAAGATEVVGASVPVGTYVAYGDSATPGVDKITHESGLTTLCMWAELVQVTGYSGGKIQFAEPLTRNYGVLKLSPWTPMRGLVIDDVKFNGFNGSNAGCGSCLVVGPTIDLTVKNSTFCGASSSQLKICISKGVVIANCHAYTDTNAGSERYMYEFGRCTYVTQINCTSGVGRWGSTGQGIRFGLCLDCYFEYGSDPMDHGMGGSDVVMLRVSKKKDLSTFNAGNASWYKGNSAEWIDCHNKTAAPLTGSDSWTVYPNANLILNGCTTDKIAVKTYPPDSSGLTGDQGPNSIELKNGTVIERGTYGAYNSATGPSGGKLIECAYNDVVDAAGSKLGSLTIGAGCSLLCCTFGPPINMSGMVGTCVVTIAGTIGLQWDNSSVPAAQVNNGNHTFNLNGMTLRSTKTSSPSASTDVVRVNSGVSGCTVNRGTAITVTWDGGSSTETPMSSGRVNDVSGLATVV